MLALYGRTAALASPLLRMMLRRRIGRGKEIAERIPERCGYGGGPRPEGRLIWVHCASLGEATSMLSVIEALVPLLGPNPRDGNVLVTTGTVTSAKMLADRLLRLNLNERVLHRFVPLDVPAWCARFIDHWRPDAAVFVESEIWPNLLAACFGRSIPSMLVNGRMSDRSFRRWRRLPRTGKLLFGGFSQVIAQSGEDAGRLRQLGAGPVTSMGNLKYAASPLPVATAELDRLRAVLSGRPVWLAASTHPGEETIALAVHSALRERHARLVTIIVPRHPNRAAAIALIAGAVTVTRRSAGDGPPAGEGVWLADTMGELGLFYSLVGHAFMGASMVPMGGHNPLEPARLGCAVAIGPYTENCADAAAVLEEAGALTRVADAPALAEWVERMIRDESVRRCMGDAGMLASRRYGGLSERVAAMILKLARA